jgi:hypothetical protein
MAMYIPRILYLCDKKYFKNIPLGSHAHHSCSCAHELTLMLHTITTLQTCIQNGIQQLDNMGN